MKRLRLVVRFDTWLYFMPARWLMSRRFRAHLAAMGGRR